MLLNPHIPSPVYVVFNSHSPDDSVEWIGGVERWNGTMEWNGGMEWNGMTTPSEQRVGNHTAGNFRGFPLGTGRMPQGQRSVGVYLLALTSAHV